MKKKRLFLKIIIILSGLFILFTIFGFFVAPPILKSLLVKNISNALKREVSILKIEVNPLKLTIKVSGINIREREKTNSMFSLDELFVNAEFSSIFRRALILEEIKLKRPYINIIRNKDGTYNFSDLLAMGTKKDGPEQRKADETRKKPFYFSLNNISITDGSIDFYDGPVGVRHNVREMNIKVPFISNLVHHAKTHVQPYFFAKINDDAYEIKGYTLPFADPREAQIDINIQDLDIPKYLAYFPIKMNFKLVSGSIDIAAKISFIDYKDKAPSLVLSANAILRKLAGDDMEKKLLFRLPSAEIDIKSIEPFQKTMEITKVLFQSPELSIQRGKDGVWNINKLIKEEETDVKSEKKGKDKSKKTESTKDGEKQFTLNLNELIVQKGKAAFNDMTTPQPVNIIIKDLELKAENISLEKENISNLLLSFAFDKKGFINLKGQFKINPVWADLAVHVKNIHINTLQPYFTDRINIHLTDGAMSTSGKFSLALPEKTGSTIKYNGSILISNLSTIDKASAEPLLNLKAFAVNNLNFNSNPLSVHIDGISLTDFFAKVTVNKDGRLNLQNIMVEGEMPKDEAVATQKTQPKKELKQKEPEKDIKIGDLTLQGGTIEFTDRAIEPSYTANLTEIGGKVSGIAFKGERLAEVNLRGKINQFVPLEITGKINPAKENLLVDLFARFNSLDLSPMTPYSGKYIGYKIEKGKLSIDLKYLIAKRKLDSQNVIFIDQLTLGDSVDSPVATKLPVRLAIALLKDRNGQIKLDIPVSGSLDDPKFSVWRIVLQVIINLLTKAATAPFALLGSLFGGGEEISYVEFDYGDHKINEQNMKKMENLAKALYERPAIKLDIQGHVDTEKDREALKKSVFMRKIKAQKLNTMIKKGERALPVDDVKVEPNEYDKYLKMVYDGERFAKPKTAIGTTKSLPSQEMEKLIYTHIDIKDEDLRTLANQRAASAKEALLKTGKVTVDRVFIIEPKTLAPEKRDKIKDSRVDFSLK